MVADGMLKLIRNKVYDILNAQTGSGLALNGIQKIYNGVPGSIPNYPAIILDWDITRPTQKVKGTRGRRKECYLNVVVAVKYQGELEERVNLACNWSDAIEKVLVDNRYLGKLADTTTSPPLWKVLDSDIEQTDFVPLHYNKPETFVMGFATIRMVISTEGL